MTLLFLISLVWVPCQVNELNIEQYHVAPSNSVLPEPESPDSDWWGQRLSIRLLPTVSSENTAEWPCLARGISCAPLNPGAAAIRSECPWARWVTPCLQVPHHLGSLFLVAAEAEHLHPAFGVSSGKGQKKMKALFCTWLDICISESPCCVDDATAGALLLNVNFVHRLDSKLVLDPCEI